MNRPPTAAPLPAAANFSPRRRYLMTNDDLEEAIRAVQGGDAGAFGAIVTAYERPVFNLAYRMVRDVEDARDIAQAVFLKALQRFGTYDPRFKLFSWLYRLALNESIDFLKRRSAPRAVEPDRGPQRTPEDDLRGAEVSRGVQEALMEITPDHRAVIVLRHFLDLGYREMAEVLEIPEKTVKSRLFTARQSLRDVLAARGLI